MCSGRMNGGLRARESTERTKAQKERCTEEVQGARPHSEQKDKDKDKDNRYQIDGGKKKGGTRGNVGGLYTVPIIQDGSLQGKDKKITE